MLSNDVLLNGVAYNVVPGAYKKTLRKRLSPSKPAARRITRTEIAPFHGGLGQAVVEGNTATAGWEGLTVGPAFDGLGVEPFPNVAATADATLDVPTTTLRAYGVVAGANAFIGMGRRIYKSVVLTNGTWSSLVVAADLGAGFTISGLAYFQDDLLIMLSTGQDIRRLNTATNAVTIWRTGEKAQRGAAYAGQFIYAPLAANNQEELRLSGTKWNGNAVTHFRYLDAPIITMAHFNGKVAIATRKSLYFMGGQPYPGEADDAAITGDSSRAPEWRGDPEPVMTHGVFAEGDDFTFLESYRGKLYTWLGGRVAEFDDSAEQGRWARMGPEGTACHGACVAGDWLVVAVTSRYGGNFELWGFNGEGWWRLGQRAAAGGLEYLWPCPLAGAGNRDLLCFRDGGGTFDLFRLKWRSTTLHTYPDSGSWTSPLIDGGDPSADKAWRAIGATFASPSVRGNSASIDPVSFPLEYSLDGGATWATVQDTPASSGSIRLFTRGQEFATPAQSRLLQVRQRWSSVNDWAPVLTGLWVESEDAAEYALGELAQAAYEAELAFEGQTWRRWELTIDAGDRTVNRAGQLDALTGRQKITALWDAWELGTELDFLDIDNDTDPLIYQVAIVGIEEKAVKPAGSARWGESQVALVLEESSGAGIGSGGLHSHTLDGLSDVAIAALADGHVLTWDAVAGWRNEAPSGGGAGPHDHDLLYQPIGSYQPLGNYQPLNVDLSALAGLAGVPGDVIYRDATQWQRLPKGLAGQALTMNGAATAPEWVTPAGGGGISYPFDAEFKLAADRAAFGPSIGTVFGANSAFVTEASSHYEIIWYVWFSKGTAGTVTYTITNSQPFANLDAFYEQAAIGGIQANGAVSGAGAGVATAAATALPVTGLLATTVIHFVEVRAIFETVLAGNVRLQATQSAGTMTPRRGSYYTVRKLSAGNVGSFVA